MAYTDDWENLMNGVFGAGGRPRFGGSPARPEAKPGASPPADLNALFDAPDGCLTGSRDAGGLAVYTGRCGGNVYRIAVDGAGVPVQLSGSVGGVSAEVRVLKFTQNTPPAGEKGNAHE